MASQVKKHNVRMQKWRLMIEQGIYKDKQLLKTRIRKGIPMGIRMLAWPQIINLKKFIQKKCVLYTYVSLLCQFSNNIYQISLDIPRTFPQQQDSIILRKSMNNVLKALSIVYPKIGYCQGMNFSALRLLQILDDQQTFWLLHFVYQTQQAIMRNFVDPKQVDRENAIFTQLLKQKSPKIYQTLTNKKVIYLAYTIKWFMTLYSGGVSQELFYRIFEVFLNEGWSIIFAVGLALLKSHEQQIFRKSSYSEIYQVKDIDTFMNLAYSFQITPEHVVDLGNSYDQQATKNMRESSLKKYQKQIQTRQISNKKIKDLQPQQQNFGVLNFQNKAEQVNLQIFQCLLQKPKEN